jgi:hypothetical protein
MATTAKGFPYPVGTDRVQDGDDAIKALAEAVGNYHGARIWATRVSITISNAASGNAAVTFPAGHFTAAPIVVASMSFSSTSYFAIATSSTTTGCSVSAIHRDGTLTTGTPTADVIAVQFA